MKKWIKPSILVILLLIGASFAVRSLDLDKKYGANSSPNLNELLRLVNEERKKVGVKPLYLDTRLNDTAQKKATDLTRTGELSHEDENGKQTFKWIFVTMPECKSASENLTQNIHRNDSKSAIEAWVKSPGHYTAMVNPRYKYTGFGYQGDFVVEHFCEV